MPADPIARERIKADRRYLALLKAMLDERQHANERATDLHVVILHPHEHDLTTQERMLFRMIQAAAPGSISAARLEARLPGERATTPSAYIGTLVAKTRRKLGHDAIITTPAGYRLGTLPGG